MWVAKYKYTKGNVKFDGLESLEEVGFATFGHKLDFKCGLHAVNLWSGMVTTTLITPKRFLGSHRIQ